MAVTGAQLSILFIVTSIFLQLYCLIEHCPPLRSREENYSVVFSVEKQLKVQQTVRKTQSNQLVSVAPTTPHPLQGRTTGERPFFGPHSSVYVGPAWHNYKNLRITLCESSVESRPCFNRAIPLPQISQSSIPIPQSRACPVISDPRVQRRDFLIPPA